IASTHAPVARKTIKVKGVARFVFVSRVSPTKNLEFALRVLGTLHGEVSFDVFGPIESSTYWNSCLESAKRLCPNVALRYRGTVMPEEVGAVFAAYEFFLFPTLGENFGHSILESLAAGTPVALSDATQWHDLESRGAGWCVPLADETRWQNVLARCVAMDQAQHVKMQEAASRAAVDYASGTRSEEMT